MEVMLSLCNCKASLVRIHVSGTLVTTGTLQHNPPKTDELKDTYGPGFEIDKIDAKVERCVREFKQVDNCSRRGPRRHNSHVNAMRVSRCIRGHGGDDTVATSWEWSM